MIWIYLTFIFLFFNELGFIGYQTYLYNIMCMDLFIEGDFQQNNTLLSFIMFDIGTIFIENSEIDNLIELSPISLNTTLNNIQFFI